LGRSVLFIRDSGFDYGPIRFETQSFVNELDCIIEAHLEPF